MGRIDIDSEITGNAIHTSIKAAARAGFFCEGAVNAHG
jgi:hypothetical protein